MSLPENIYDELMAFKPQLKHKIGDVVWLVTDKELKWPMMITDFDTDEDCTSDYYCKWMNAKGEMESDAFPEEILIKK